jgi:hypothetical protein
MDTNNERVYGYEVIRITREKVYKKRFRRIWSLIIFTLIKAINADNATKMRALILPKCENLQKCECVSLQK